MGIAEVIPRRAVFLDRDGVVNRNVFDPATGEFGAPRLAGQFELAGGAIEAMRELRDGGFLLFLVSNQPNYAKGKSSLEELAGVHGRLVAVLNEAKIEFAEFYYCYHHPQGTVAGYSGPCECRKPSPHFVFKARDAFGLSLDQSWIVGDRSTDIECGRAAGLRTIRVKEDHPAKIRAADEMRADFEANDLTDAAEIIVSRSTPLS